ncbi:hypothetical protein GCM10027162_60300 [Streptomyces incanus]
MWLLRHPADAGEHVLFLDARGLGTVQSGGRRVLAYDDVSSVIDSYTRLFVRETAPSDRTTPLR